MKNLGSAVADRINKYLNDKDLTQYKLAELSGVPFSTIKSIMQRHTKSINLKTIILLSHGLNIKPCEFIDDDSFLFDNLDIE